MCTVFFSLLLLGTVCGFTIGCLNLIDYNYTVRCCTTYEYVFAYTCHVFLLLLLCVLLSCCCCSCSAAAVRHRVPDGVLCCCGLLRLIPVFSSASLKHDLFSKYPVAVLSHVHPRCTYNPIIHTIHPRSLRACAEPRRVATRRSEAPLVHLTMG